MTNFYTMPPWRAATAKKIREKILLHSFIHRKCAQLFVGVGRLTVNNSVERGTALR